MIHRLPLLLAVNTRRELPLDSELAELKVGDLVKVGVGENGKGSEAFWVEIESVSDDRLSGRVDNELVHTAYHGYAYNQKIDFCINNVLQIYY